MFSKTKLCIAKNKSDYKKKKVFSSIDDKNSKLRRISAGCGIKCIRVKLKYTGRL